MISLLFYCLNHYINTIINFNLIKNTLTKINMKYIIYIRQRSKLNMINIIFIRDILIFDILRYILLIKRILHNLTYTKY